VSAEDRFRFTFNEKLDEEFDFCGDTYKADKLPLSAIAG